jgi:hypothetical protein
MLVSFNTPVACSALLIGSCSADQVWLTGASVTAGTAEEPETVTATDSSVVEPAVASLKSNSS